MTDVKSAFDPARVWWSLVLLCLVHQPVMAQLLGSELPGSWMSAASHGPPAPGLEPSTWLGPRGIGVSLGGSVVCDIGGNHLLTLGGPGSLGPVLELRAQGARTSLQQSEGARAVSALLHFVRPEYGAWLASSGFQVDHTHGMLPLLGAGAWLERGRFSFATQVVQLLSPVRTARPEPTSKAPADTAGITRFEPGRGPIGAGEDVRLLTGGEASLTWTLRRFALQSRIGVAVGAHHEPARWGEMGVAYRATPGMDLFMRVRSATGAPASLEAVPEPQAVLGIQLAAGPAALTTAPRAERAQGLRLESLAGSRYRLDFALHGRSVDVNSDATDWIPFPASQVAPGRWEVTLVLCPGVHHIAVRVDGGPWQAPPGLPAAPDGFGGEVGLITAE